MTEELFNVFTELSVEFDKKYKTDPNFIQRLHTWSAAIDATLKPGDIVYDLGCGSGIFSFYAASKGADVTGIDGSEGMIQLCNEKRASAGRQQDLRIRFEREALPLKDATKYTPADLILCSSMFEYIPEKEKMIECCRALLRTDGRLLISVPNRRSIYRVLEKISYRIIGKPSYCRHVFNRYTEQELIAEFEKFGFVPRERRYYADNYLFSGLLKFLLPPGYSANLLLVVFQKIK